MTPTPVTFFFDAGCPFTWRTSRWLTEVADTGAAEVTWRLMSLAVLNEGKEIPEQYRSAMEQGKRVQRVLAAAEAHGGSAELGRLYTEVGTRLHEKGEPPTDDTLAAAVAAAGLPASVAAAAGDEGLEAAVRAGHEEAQAAVGQESGSPVLQLGAVAWFGPVVVPPPTGAEALRLFDALQLLAEVPGFSELKTRRNAF